jgi:hypothetical protein
MVTPIALAGGVIFPGLSLGPVEAMVLHNS